MVDGRWSIIGSANLNTRSRQLDEENAFGIRDSAFARDLEHTFFSDVAKADEIGLASWRTRSPRLRLVHWLARLLDHQS